MKPNPCPTKAEPPNRDYHQPIDLTIRIGSLQLKASILIIIISTLFFIPLLSPLFKPGPLINSDIGVHYSAFVCYKKGTMWSLPTAWCSHGQAGLARYQRHGVVHAYLAVFLSWFMPLELAFKVMVVLVFMILPLSAFLFLRWAGYPLAGAIAYAIFLFEPGGTMWGGFSLHFYVTAIVNITGTGLSVATLFAVVWMLERINPLRVSIAGIVSAIYFLSHPGSALWFPIALLPAMIIYRRGIMAHWDLFLMYPLLAYNLAAFWFIPALFKASYFQPPGLGALVDFNLTNFITNLPFLKRSLVLTGIAAAFTFLFRREKPIRLLGFTLFAIPLVWQISPHLPYLYTRYFTIDRSFYEFRTLIILCASLLLGGCWPRIMHKKRTLLLLLGLALTLTFLWKAYPISKEYTNYIFTGKDIEQYVLPVFDYVRNANGRIIAENTFSQFGLTPISMTQPWSLSAAYSDREFLGNSDFWYILPDYSVAYQSSLFGRGLINYSISELVNLLWHLNVQYIWASGNYDPYFTLLFPQAKGFNSTFGKIYETPWEHSYLHYAGGNLSRVTYNVTRASATAESEKGGVLYFKVRHWPNWQATIDGKPTEISKDPYGLMYISIPPGRHDIRFEYRMIFVDWLGYIISGSALIGMITWALTSRKESSDDTSGMQFMME